MTPVEPTENSGAFDTPAGTNVSMTSPRAGATPLDSPATSLSHRTSVSDALRLPLYSEVASRSRYPSLQARASDAVPDTVVGAHSDSIVSEGKNLPGALVFDGVTG